MILAVFRRVVKVILRMLRRLLNTLRPANRVSDEALQEIEVIHREAWIEAGADADRAVLPRSALNEARKLVRRAGKAVRSKRHVFASEIFRRAWAERLAGSVLHILDVSLAKATGSTGFVWLKTTSVHPRSEHLKRVGRFYRWGQLEEEPGEAWGCKCGARPIFS